MKLPNVTTRRIPDPGGSQGSPQAGPRRVLLLSWLVAYLVIIACVGLSYTARHWDLAAAFGVPPVLLFIGLNLLGALTPKTAWGFVALWIVACIAAVVLTVVGFCPGGHGT